MDYMYIEKITDLFTVYGDFERAVGFATKNGNAINYKNSEIELSSVTHKHSSGVFERCDTIKIYQTEILKSAPFFQNSP